MIQKDSVYIRDITFRNQEEKEDERSKDVEQSNEAEKEPADEL